MKLSISLPDEDVAALDRFVDAVGLPSLSAAIQRAIRMLGDPAPDGAHAVAWEEWEALGATADWEGTLADGITGAAR